MRQRATHTGPLPVALLLGLVVSALVGCVDKDAVFVDKPAFQEPSDTKNNFLGYVQPVDQGRPLCGNCHATFAAAWGTTAHAHAWEGLQSSDHAADYCEPCHTISENGNPVEGDAGYTLVRDPEACGPNSINTAQGCRYVDVQCESCHGPGWDHVNSPAAANAPLCSIEAGVEATTGCGECHNGAHHPFVEQWQESRHAIVNPSPAGREDCAPCHEGRAALVQKFYETSNYLERDGEEAMAITCAVCHDPHGTQYPASLRGDIEVSSLDHLCVRCHARSGQPPSRRGPHAAQGLLLLDEDVGWRPAGFRSPTVNAHAGLANPKLCVTCHVTTFEVTEPEVFQSVGHRFEAISCLDENGLPVEGPCANEERDFRACVGCHRSEERALQDYENFVVDLNGWLDELWFDSDGNEVMDATDAGLLPMVVAMGDPIELDPSDGFVTVAEGALYNAQLAYTSERTQWEGFRVFDVSVSAHKASGNGAHNPWLLEALLKASIDAVIEHYGLVP